MFLHLDDAVKAGCVVSIRADKISSIQDSGGGSVVFTDEATFCVLDSRYSILESIEQIFKERK